MPSSQHQILDAAVAILEELRGELVDVLDIRKPTDLNYALHLGKVISKLSPLIGNMLEYRITTYLNHHEIWNFSGNWIRQDPYFPDTKFVGELDPAPGIEIKTWFPLATEITARFRESQRHLIQGNIDVALVAWLPEHLIWGRPKIIDVWVAPALSIARARDQHYHQPPHYLVIEPEDTSERTRNLRQTNTSGYRIQLPADSRKAQEILTKAEVVVRSWGREGRIYSTDARYQRKLRNLMGRFDYRLDTNFAKMDRIQHSSLEQFKQRVLKMIIKGNNILSWARAINKGDTKLIQKLF